MLTELFLTQADLVSLYLEAAAELAGKPIQPRVLPLGDKVVSVYQRRQTLGFVEVQLRREPRLSEALADHEFADFRLEVGRSISGPI